MDPDKGIILGDNSDVFVATAVASRKGIGITFQHYRLMLSLVLTTASTMLTLVLLNKLRCHAPF